MRYFYSILIQIGERLLPVIGIFSKSKKVRDFIEGRKIVWPSIEPKNNRKRYWFHCASLGEYEQALPIIEVLKSHHNAQIVLSFFSPSGYNQKKNTAIADVVVYMPIDTRRNAKKFVEYLDADVAVFVKYEIWYNHLMQLSGKNIPVYLLSAVFRSNQFIFKPYSKWLFDVLKLYQCIFIQDKGTFELLCDKGLENLMLTGDTRYDRVKSLALNVKDNDMIKNFKSNHSLIVLGSSWHEEEQLVRKLSEWYIQQGNKIMIAPHDISEQHIDELVKMYEQFSLKLYTDGESRTCDVLILNTIGHLASSYCYGDLAIVGGAFGKGLHNILEPLSYGVPVIFGSNYQKYPEAKLAIGAGVARSINNVEELQEAIDFFMPNNEQLKLQLRAKCIDFINWQSGASEKVLKKMGF
jgi:3-deoxy-D-manno-octulosonic-acid transferase